MSFFTKPTYKVMDLPFVYDCFSADYEESMENGVFDIEAYGVIDGEQKYLFGCYNLKKQELYEDGSFDRMMELLKDSQGKYVRVILKYKKEKLVGFEIMPESLANIYGDERFLEMECLGYGINNTSYLNRG